MRILGHGLMVWLACCFCLYAKAQKKYSNPLPTTTQLAWHDAAYYLFVHFGPNTFTNEEWGHGHESAHDFNPTALDCDQWCKIAKAAGAKGIIITAKHHDGFCLWPSKYSTHTVQYSQWKNGQGDVLNALSTACKKAGLLFGVYLSPWDRNHPTYGTDAYNEVYVGMMKEIFEQYGPIWELWWDGANGEGPNGKKQVYNWDLFKKTVQTLSPNTVVFSDIGPHIRWVGNEDGHAGTTNWNCLDTVGFTPGAGAPKQDTLTKGNRFGAAWIPAECDVSIRNGWFYHATEDATVKTPAQLFQLYLKSVGRGANLLLNVPPNRAGLFSAVDSAALMGFAALRREAFANNVLQNAHFSQLKQAKNTYTQTILLSKPTKINCILLEEAIRYGQQIGAVQLDVYAGDQQVKTLSCTTIGHQRILSFPNQQAVSKIIIRITDYKLKPILKSVQAFQIPDALIEH